MLCCNPYSLYLQNLYTAWKGHFHTGTPRWGKSHLIEGLLDEEVSIDWDRVISWLEELLPRQNPPVMPSGIVSQFWDTDCAMFRAVRARQAVVPHVEVRIISIVISHCSHHLVDSLLKKRRNTYQCIVLLYS